MSAIRVRSLHIYPVKSCSAVNVVEARIGPRGFEHDRQLMLVDEAGEFMTQRDHPWMALIEALRTADTLTLKAEGIAELNTKIKEEGPPVDVEIWGDPCQAVDQGDDAASWFSEFLKKPCRLLAMRRSFKRTLDPRYRISKADQTGFADGYPFLLISQASLDDLNRRLEEPIPMNRFRPNIVVEGCAPYEEDNWQRIRIGKVDFEVVKPCVRCVITTTDQETAQRFKEPLRTLATYRRVESGGVIFGQNLIQHSTGTVSLGMSLEIIKRK